MLVFSDACWPVRVSKLSGVSTPEDAQRMEVYAEGLMTRARREGVLCVQVVDTRAQEKVDATTRAAFADLEKRRGNEFNTCLAGTVVIIKSAVVRGALTAVMWLAGRRATLRVVSDGASAVAEAKEAAARAQARATDRAGPRKSLFIEIDRSEAA